jgi:hypothetical protein
MLREPASRHLCYVNARRLRWQFVWGLRPNNNTTRNYKTMGRHLKRVRTRTFPDKQTLARGSVPGARGGPPSPAPCPLVPRHGSRSTPRHPHFSSDSPSISVALRFIPSIFTALGFSRDASALLPQPASTRAGLRSPHRAPGVPVPPPGPAALWVGGGGGGGGGSGGGSGSGGGAQSPRQGEAVRRTWLRSRSTTGG